MLVVACRVRKRDRDRGISGGRFACEVFDPERNTCGTLSDDVCFSKKFGDIRLYSNFMRIRTDFNKVKLFTFSGLSRLI